MESQKKLIVVLLLLFLSCNDKTVYYNEQHDIIKPSKLKRIKNNLYIDSNNNIFIKSENIVLEVGKNENIIQKKKGFILQDSIFDVNNNLMPMSNLLDIKSYFESEKDIFYQDKNHVYMNKGSQYSDYPFVLTEFQSKYFSLIAKSNYFKYKNEIYYYGYAGYAKLKNADGNKFKVDSIKTNVNKYMIIGNDEKNIYHNSEKINYEDLKMLPINQKLKDSLKYIYFL
ncbi:hypothetical protein QWZ06_12200 [Chryseobacterium tructae]|uniref:DKNYY family protein n=1 Tax=Chryseobacterium tructae TaxID=1037380 RepID=A0ABV7XZS2_9FLAO|nr:hypothetical protein [Chryseobacterium tructae]MDN3692989.1 hypothetical protein [Chryseobacterium tructae]